MSNDLNVTVHFEDGTFWATVEQFPGVFAAGATLDELRVSLQEGIALVLAEPGKPAPRVELADIQVQPVVASASTALVYA